MIILLFSKIHFMKTILCILSFMFIAISCTQDSNQVDTKAKLIGRIYSDKGQLTFTTCLICVECGSNQLKAFNFSTDTQSFMDVNFHNVITTSKTYGYD